MADFSKKETLFITCPKQLPPYLKQELEELGFKVLKAHEAGVEIEGDLFDCMKLNLTLRVAHRVLYPLFKSKAKDLDGLYKEIVGFEWEEWIPLSETISIYSFAKQDGITNHQVVNLKAKDAIVDRMREKTGERPNSGSGTEHLIFRVHWVKDELLVYLDTSGESLSRRGYKRDNFKAPIQESLAAAIVMEAEVEKFDNIVNPMCGSGTLAIEAVMRKFNIYPAAIRKDFSITKVKDFPEEIFNSLKRSYGNIPPLVKNRIIATDYDKKALEASRKNARKLGVEHLIYWDLCEFRKTKIPAEGSLAIVINPPYGIRVGANDRLDELYASIGDFFKKHKRESGKACLITSSFDFVKALNCKYSRKQQVYNTTLSCQLATFKLDDISREGMVFNKSKRNADVKPNPRKFKK